MSNDNKHIAVIGGAGFVGRAFCELLEQKGIRFTIIDAFTVDDENYSRQFVRKKGWAYREVDITDQTKLASCLAILKPTHIVHLAAIHFIPDCNRRPLDVLTTNVAGTQHIIEAAANLPFAPSLLFVSSAAVYAPNQARLSEESPVGTSDVYGMSKLLAEQLIEKYAGRWNIVRLFNVYGNRDPHAHLIPEVIRQIKSGTPLQLGNGQSYRDFVHVDDVAQGIYAVLCSDQQAQIFNIASGQSHRISEVVDILCKAHHYSHAADYGHSDRVRYVDNPKLWGDTTKLQTMTNWYPRQHLHEALAMVEQ